jgi:glycosyltransferase involved in cell wall biosynthesis
MKSWLVRRSAGSVVPGSAAREYLLSMGADPDRIWLAPNAVANDIYGAASASRDNRRGPVRFLFVGRLESAKGIAYLLDAWSRYRVAGELIIAGEGPLGRAIGRRVADTTLRGVELTGHLDRERLAKAYGAADVFVFPSVSDPWGLVVNEAMASGLPIITTVAPGAVDDLVLDGDNGYVVRPFASEPLLRAMEQLGMSRELRLQMGRRSTERIRDFEPGAWADGMATAVRSVGAN